MKIKKINQSAGVVANVTNSLNSDSSIDALSAAAGKKLKEEFNNYALSTSSWRTSGLSMHISFDDVELCITNLKNNSYSSLFEEPFLNLLKGLHDKYDTCFSLYVYTDVWNTLEDNYKEEWKENSNWLKVGYHSLNADNNAASSNHMTNKINYTSFVENTLRICGTNRIIDRIPRLQNYSGIIFGLSGFIDAPCGVIGFLDADDDRNSYLHNYNTKNWREVQYEYYDSLLNLHFIKTNFRLENITDIETELDNILNTTNSTNRNIEIFTHEWWLYDGVTISNVNILERCCSWSVENNIPFNFVENKLSNFTGGWMQNNLTITRVNRSNNDISTAQGILLPFYRNSTIGQLKKRIGPNANGCLCYVESPVNFGLEGMFIKPSNCTQLQIRTNLDGIQCAIYEVNGRMIQGNHTENGYQFDQWLDCINGQTNFTIQNDTQMIGLCFKTADDRELSDADVLMNVYAVWIL